MNQREILISHTLGVLSCVPTKRVTVTVVSVNQNCSCLMTSLAWASRSLDALIYLLFNNG